MRLAYLPAITLALCAAPVGAQPAPAPLLSPAALERMCSPAGTMQFAFGQTGVPGASKLESLLGGGFALPETLAPFAKAQPRATEWSGQFMEMVYSFPAADEAAAFAQLEELGWLMEDAGWSQSDIEQGNPPLYLFSYGGFVTFEKPAGDTRVLLGLDYALGEATLSCGRDDLLRIHAGEAFGNLPPGTPRPQVPELAIPLITDPRECEGEAMQAQMHAMLATGEQSAFMATMLARTTYRDRLTSWMLWKLDSSGQLIPEDLVNLSLSSVGDASPGGNPFAAFAMIEEMLPIIESLGAAEEADDVVALCRAMISFHEWTARVDAITLAQTEALHKRLEAEALRLGVSLD